MIKTTRKILFYMMLALLGFNLSCERIDPVDMEGEGEEFVTVIQPSVILMDSVDYKFIGIIDQFCIIEMKGNPGIPSMGDIVCYYDSETHLSGRIDEITSEGQILRLKLEQLPLNEIFKFLSLEFSLEELDRKYLYINPKAGLNEDTLSFAPMEFLWQNGGDNSGLLNLDSLIILNNFKGAQQFFISPVWEDETGTRKLELSYKQVHLLKASLRMVSKGEIDVSDSIELREQVYGPYMAGPLPVMINIKERLIIEVQASDDNSFQTGFSSEGQADISANYLPRQGMQFLAGQARLSGQVQRFIWDKSHSFNAALRMKTIITPVFCGSAGLPVSIENEMQISANNDWPDWDYAITLNQMAGFLSNELLFSGLPNENMTSSVEEYIILNESGQLENNAPVPRFNVQPASGYTDTNFSFNAGNSYDPEDGTDELQVRWDFNGDEVWDSNYSFDKQAFHIFPTPGNFTVILEVRDTKGLTARLAKNVNVQAVSSAPTAFFTVSPESGRTADLFTFDASGCWDSEDDVSLLKVRWDFDGDDIWDTQFSTVKAAFRFFTTAGTYVVKLEVKDTQGLTGSTSRIIEVAEANIKPTAFFTVSPEEGTIVTNFLFDASGSSDPEDNPDLLQVRWDFENDGTWDTEYRTIKTVSHVFDLAGVYTVVLQVLDTDGFSNTYSLNVTVRNPNTAPKADFTITPSVGTVDTVFIFDARISTDLEDSLEQLQFRWDWDNNDVYDTEWFFNPVEQRTFDRVGTYIVKLQVKDSGGLTHSKARLVIIE